MAAAKPKHPQHTSAARSTFATSNVSKHVLVPPFNNLNRCAPATMRRTSCFIVRDCTGHIANEGAPQRQEEILLSLIRLRSISLDGTVAAMGCLVFAEGHFEYKKHHTEFGLVTIRRQTSKCRAKGIKRFTGTCAPDSRFLVRGVITPIVAGNYSNLTRILLQYMLKMLGNPWTPRIQSIRGTHATNNYSNPF